MRGGKEGFLAGFLFHPVIWTAAVLARDAHSMTVGTSASTRGLACALLRIQHMEGTIYLPSIVLELLTGTMERSQVA